MTVNAEYPRQEGGLFDASNLRRERAELLDALRDLVRLIDEAGERPAGDNGISDSDGAIGRAREMVRRFSR